MIAALSAAAVLSVSLAASADSIEVGRPELLYRHEQLPPVAKAGFPGDKLGIDGSFATLKAGKDSLDFFVSIGWGGMIKYRGTVQAPLGPAGSTHPTEVWRRSMRELFPKDPFLHTKAVGALNYCAAAWIPNIYRIDSTRLLGLVHIEDNRATGAYGDATLYSIGLAYSGNGGVTWKYCGDILRAHLRNGLSTNIGGVPYLVVRDKGADYLYVYFNEYAPEGREPQLKRPAVARALLSKVVGRILKDSTVVPPDWKKYHAAKGGWTEDSFTGTGSAILPLYPGYGRIYHYDMHSDAAYCRSLKKYLLTVSHEADYGPSDEHDRGLLLFASGDGIKWQPSAIIEPDKDKRYPFSSFICLSDTSDTSDTSQDCHEVGKEFYLIAPRKPSDLTEWRDEIYLRKISVSRPKPRLPAK